MTFENAARIPMPDTAQKTAQSDTYHDALAAVNALLGSGASPDIFVEAGETLARLGMTEEAAEAFQHAAERGGPDAPAHGLRAADLYFQIGIDDKALLLAMQLYRVMPDNPDLAYIMASLFIKSGDWQLVDLVKNTLVASDRSEHLRLAARLIGDDVRNTNNLVLFKKLRALHPDDNHIRFALMGFAREFCDYDVLDVEEAALEAQLAAGFTALLTAETPHNNLMWCDDESLNGLATNVRNLPVVPRTSAAQRRSQPHVFADKIRIGYLSSDFWDDHATMRLFQSVLTAHDASRFDITLFCYTPDMFVGFDGGNRASWNRIVPIGHLSDAEAEATIRSFGIDILVDLKGHTGGARSAIMNRMAAPVQVAWLGFPGSTVNIDCDYVIGDPVVLPDSAKPHYHEKFCRLPETYQPNDPVFRALPAAASRASLGLPEPAFVFAAFNSSRKISRPTIALWSRILKGTENTVLWIMCDSDTARDNIAKRLTSAGIAESRVIFAAKMAYESHVARLQAADLGLDTFPYNGHTTTSDKLWAGLPVITAKGSNFASRVSESLLNAIGLSDLVAEDHEDFCNLAIRLASDRSSIAALKQRLQVNRFVSPLFDAERFCRHLETAYQTMADRAKSGQEPLHFDVPALPPRTAPFLLR
ncbi:O-linked N-acetylglucosamine transferase, SPINDLY family protein [Pararhizobium sp.]|uniref:O-linked N-acetylglucosamine transferase, SPINDLY family protein n=1 Tax=Pararhizobium sp. TaxID=1977563 RepID=UPI00271C7FA9|nr:hypothetical protein [Pararhizobium sp.]MDO9418653.1 hypothetical protein [Pararhizobium sp.]